MALFPTLAALILLLAWWLLFPCWLGGSYSLSGLVASAAAVAAAARSSPAPALLLLLVPQLVCRSPAISVAKSVSLLMCRNPLCSVN